VGQVKRVALTILNLYKPAIDDVCAARVEFAVLYSYQLGKPCKRRMPYEASEAEADKKRMLFDEADVSLMIRVLR
jgi:hypothetical protein